MSIDGTWISRGYGWILEISPDGYALFDHTTLACVEFERGSKSQFEAAFDRVQLDGPDRLSLFVRGEISRYDFDRTATPPPASQILDRPGDYDPFFIFDSFCEYFRQDYVFFELREVNWDQHCKRLRNSVRPDTNPDELFEILATLILDLRGNHVILRDGQKLATSDGIAELKSLMVKQFDLKSPSIGDPATIAKVQPFVCSQFLDSSCKSAGNGAVSWGFVGRGVGYLNVLKLFGLANTEMSRNAADLPPHRYDHARLLEDDLQALEEILDRVMSDLGQSSAIVLDIRINGGGFDRLGMAIASRFCASQHLAFTKEARDGDGFTPVQNFYVTPGQRPSFTKPVYVLTSARTASAGDVLALCMRALPQVTIVGERTTGILSDNLSKHLPNGWITSLSNEIYRAPDGAIYEGSGVPVDITVPVFDAVDFAGGMQRAIDTSKRLALAAGG